LLSLLRKNPCPTKSDIFHGWWSILVVTKTAFGKIGSFLVFGFLKCNQKPTFDSVYILDSDRECHTCTVQIIDKYPLWSLLVKPRVGSDFKRPFMRIWTADIETWNPAIPLKQSVIFLYLTPFFFLPLLSLPTMTEQRNTLEDYTLDDGRVVKTTSRICTGMRWKTEQVLRQHLPIACDF
jgi:hypothetical protein